MSAYSKEFSDRKALVVKDLRKFISQIESGEIQIDGNEPKMSKRVLRSLLLSTDKTYKKLVDNYLDSNYKYKAKKGKALVPRIESFKNAGRSLIETQLPKPLRRIETDRIHHGTPLEVGAIVEDMAPDELLKFLQDYEKEDVFFADSDQNTRGGSFDEREHTGARPKSSKSKTVYPNEMGEPGVTEMSAHPRGTRDKAFNVPDRPTTAAAAREVVQPLLEQNAIDQDIGRQVANPRRTWINNKLIEMGAIEPGTDIFSSTIDDATLKRVAPLLKSPEFQRGAAEAFKTPTRIVNGSVQYNAGDPLSAAMDPIMKNRIGALTGVLFEGYNMETIKKLEQGNIEGAGLDIATGGVAGAAIEAGSKAIGADKLLGKAVVPVAAFNLASQGRDGSTTKYLADTYGEKVGMNQNRPSWGTEIGEMNTEKPGYVQATEDAFDYLGEKTTQAINGVINFTKKLGTRPANSDFTTL